jgi:hypothetical protein
MLLEQIMRGAKLSKALLFARRRAIWGAFVAMVAMWGVGMAFAQSSSATYAIPRQSIDGGAQRAASATFRVDGTVGQPDAGAAMSSATFSVRGGFHRAAGSAQSDLIFANGFEP